MYPDFLFDFIGQPGHAWIGIGILYALFNYSYDTIFCWVIGGIYRINRFIKFINAYNMRLKTRRKQKRKIKQKAPKIIRSRLAKILRRQFAIGGKDKLSEFRKDPLSWAWPIFALFVPIAIYGITRDAINRTVAQLFDAGILLSHYRLPILEWVGDDTQIVLWLCAIGFGLSTFYRYEHHRSRPTWFSRPPIFHLSRVLIFNNVLGYIILNICLQWLDFATALYRGLLDNSIGYQTLYPDLMYGLKPAYNSTIGIGLSFILISILPVIMLLREKHEKYSRIYKYLLYLGIFIGTILVGLLIYQFDQRLEIINETALTSVLTDFTFPASQNQVSNGTNPTQSILALQYYSVITSLPKDFPIPSWFQYIFSARLILLSYELYILLSSKSEQKSLSEILRYILKKLSE